MEIGYHANMHQFFISPSVVERHTLQDALIPTDADLSCRQNFLISMSMTSEPRASRIQNGEGFAEALARHISGAMTNDYISDNLDVEPLF
jgi:hypothetical protein